MEVIILMIKNTSLFTYPLEKVGSYYLGLFLADGCLTKNRNRRFILSSIDYEVIEGFANALISNNKIRTRPEEIKNYKGKEIYAKEQYSLEESSDRIVEDLNSLGISQKRRVILLDESKLSLSDYLRGFLDGDGYISVSVVSQSNSRNLKLVMGFVGRYNEIIFPLFCFLNNEMNIRTHHPKRDFRNKDVWEVKLGGENAILLLNWLYQDASIFILRKRNIYDKYLVAKKQEHSRSLLKNALNKVGSNIISDTLGVDTDTIHEWNRGSLHIPNLYWNKLLSVGRYGRYWWEKEDILENL